MKATWKKRGISPGRIGEVLRTSRTMAEAARTLKVNYSTLHRWLKADPQLMRARESRRATAEQAISVPLPPDAWERKIATEHALTDSDRELLGLARRALEIAHDMEATIMQRLSAMGRFQRLVLQLNLQAPAEPVRSKPDRPTRPDRVADPRAVIKAVS